MFIDELRSIYEPFIKYSKYQLQHYNKHKIGVLWKPHFHNNSNVKKLATDYVLMIYRGLW